MTPRARWLAAAAAWLQAVAWAGTIGFAIDRVQARMAGAVVPGGHALSFAELAALWGGHATLALCVVATAALGAAIGARFREPARAQRVATFLLVATPAHLAGDELASGPWIAEQSWAPLVHATPIVLAAIVVVALLRLAARPRPATPGLLAMAAIAPLLAWLDVTIQPGLYPPLHMGMHALAAATTVIAARWWLDDGDDGRGRWGPRLAIAAALVAPLLWFTMPTRVRATLLLRSNVAAEWIRNAMPAPPPTLLHDTLAQLDVGAGELPRPDDTSGLEAPRRPQANVVLVVIDTLRADALPPLRPPEGTRFAAPRSTPRLDAWLAGAVRFARTYTTATETRRAMPSMFRSLWASDDPLALGVPLGNRLEALGLHPMAVVHSYFMPGKYPAIAALLDGFDEVRTYENAACDTAIPHALELVAGADDRFFLFVHLFTMHAPGFDGAPLDRRAGTRDDAYRRSLAYLDTQFGALEDGLAQLGHAQDTIVIVVGDHGEGLGDHGTVLHGPNLFEEDLRVPLAFAVPGLAPRELASPVGVVDLVPTLVDLLGGPPRPGDRGRSLLPWFVGLREPPRRSYYFENAKGSRVGLVRGDDKLVVEPRTGARHRFDLRRDPHEREDVEADDPGLVQSLAIELVGFAPAVVASELQRPAVHALLLQRLRELDPRRPGAAAPLLLRLVALAPDADALARARELFVAGDDELRTQIATTLLHDDIAGALAALGPAVTAWMRELADTPAERTTLARLAAAGVDGFGDEWAATRLESLARSRIDDPTLAAWLQLIAGWSLPAPRFAPLLRELLAEQTHLGAVGETLAVLDAAAGVFGDGAELAALRAECRTRRADRDPRVRAAAWRVLIEHGDVDDLLPARQVLRDRDEDLRVRREAARVLLARLGVAAMSELTAIVDTNAGARLAVRLLRDDARPEARALLRAIAAGGPYPDIRAEARRAVARLEPRTAE
ncbi:MAG: sulfatase-like hydrolase/transferase [Deltaproteobacteria bacterium]|nr:sulfatase-like hydrolase/transferase [Deltaproteobacteria bacterium]